MDVAIISSADWANAGHQLSMALCSVGLNSQAFTRLNHRFRYTTKNIIYANVKQITNKIKGTKCIIFMHSAYQELGLNLSKYRVFVYHGGSKYRQNPVGRNKCFNPIVERSIIQTADLLDLGAKDQVWLLPAMDTGNIKPVYKKSDNNRIVFGHYPSSGIVKNTQIINQVFNSITNNDRLIWRMSTTAVPWKINLERVGKCDVYVEACAVKQYDKVYGEWGMTCLEAACLGKVVITHFLNESRYKKEYGNHPLLVANSESELKSTIERIMLMGNEEIIDMQHATRAWVEKYHSYVAVGNRFVDKVLGGKL